MTPSDFRSMTGLQKLPEFIAASVLIQCPPVACLTVYKAAGPIVGQFERGFLKARQDGRSKFSPCLLALPIWTVSGLFLCDSQNVQVKKMVRVNQSCQHETSTSKEILRPLKFCEVTCLLVAIHPSSFCTRKPAPVNQLNVESEKR